MKIHFRLNEAGVVAVSLAGRERFGDVLRRCTAENGMELGGYIAVRAGKVITNDDLVEDGETIDVFPALSGG